VDQTITPAIPALAGTIIGALTSFATTWFITTSQTVAARLATERSKRESLYGRYMEQLATLYAHALQRETVNYEKVCHCLRIKRPNLTDRIQARIRHR
jgi:hypothetical protein